MQNKARSLQRKYNMKRYVNPDISETSTDIKGPGALESFMRELFPCRHCAELCRLIFTLGYLNASRSGQGLACHVSSCVP